MEDGGVFTNNYPMYAHNFIQLIYTVSIHTLPFTFPYIYILKIFIYGMRDFNRPMCNTYIARPVKIMISQYLIADSKKKSKDISLSWTSTDS